MWYLSAVLDLQNQEFPVSRTKTRYQVQENSKQLFCIYYKIINLTNYCEGS